MYTLAMCSKVKKKKYIYIYIYIVILTETWTQARTGKYFFSQGKFNWNWKTIYGNLAVGWAMKEPRSCKSKRGGA